MVRSVLRSSSNFCEYFEKIRDIFKKIAEISLNSAKFWRVDTNAQSRRVSAEPERRTYIKREQTTRANTQMSQGLSNNHMACDRTATSKMFQRVLWRKNLSQRAI